MKPVVIFAKLRFYPFSLNFMQNQAKQIQTFLLKHIPNQPNDIVNVTMNKFDVSRTTVLRHMQHLIKRNEVIKTGKTKQVSYMLVSSLNKKFSIPLNDTFDEFECFSTFIEPIVISQVNKNSYAILEYVITELLNNCKDHSKGKKVDINIWFDNKNVYCRIIDNGVGLFKTLIGINNYTEMRDIIFELSKGKLTRDPVNHTGEGIFFSSRAVDIFKISANGYQFYRDNSEQDWTLLEAENNVGTTIEIELKKNASLMLDDLFHNYTEDFAFTKTDLLVELSQHIGERLISRSQAKRVCRRLDNFSHVTLDFKKVEAVGQGFVDQIFRVYQNEAPDLVIHYINANPNVEYMIKRTLASKRGD